jgi:hypothetical protein
VEGTDGADVSPSSLLLHAASATTKLMTTSAVRTVRAFTPPPPLGFATPKVKQAIGPAVTPLPQVRAVRTIGPS